MSARIKKQLPCLIDTSNLVEGGGVQVAAAFLESLNDYLSRNPGARPWLANADFFVSDAVAENLGGEMRLGIQRKHRRWRMFPSAWMGGIRYEVVFTLFGPVYGARVGRREVMGYADVRSVYPRPEPLRVHRSAWVRVRARLRTRMSRRSVLNAEEVIVETTAMRSRLIDAVGIQPDKVQVVPNTWHPVFDAHRGTHAVPPASREGAVWELLYVARGYEHKNHRFLGQLGEELKRAHGVPVRFLVTLTSDEWEGLDELTRSHSHNLGPVTVGQLPGLYEEADGVIFPSLLEAFSATPLEALRSSRVLIASDRDFVRSLCQEAAAYIDPVDSVSAANVVAGILSDIDMQTSLVQRGAEMIRDWPNSEDRMTAYLERIEANLLMSSGDGRGPK